MLVMNFLELAKRRYSARDYSAQVVEREKMDYILECARFAPSAVNMQPWHFFVVQSDAQRAELQRCYPREWFVRAPLYVVVCADRSRAWVRPSDGKNHADIDAAIAVEHLCLAATEQGLGSCWVCNFDPERLAASLNLSPDQHPVAIVSLGYVQKLPGQSSARKELGEFVSFL